jgi:glucokinase
MEILVFDFGGTQGRCALATLTGQLSDVQRLKRAPNEDGGVWFQRLLNAGKNIVSQKTRIISISFGGPVDHAGRIISMHVSGWEKVDLCAEMKKQFGCAVVVDNDANCGALGEFYFGAGRGKQTMAYFTVSTGIGGGVILDGKLFRGATNKAGEFGQMVLHPGPDAPQYAAGKPGTLEALACGPAIEREGRLKLAALGQRVPDDFSAKEVFDAAREKCPWAVEVLDVSIGHLARGVAAVICAYNVERIIIGGGVSQAGSVLFDPLREKVNTYLPHYLSGEADILPAELGDETPMFGAIAQVRLSGLLQTGSR